MAWTTVGDVDNGASFGDTYTNAYRNSIMELQTAFAPVRRRDNRGTTTYTVGDTDLIPTATVETLGGISTTGGVLTLPSDGVYVFSVILNVASTHGSDDSIFGGIVRAGTAYLLNKRLLTDTSTGNVESWSAHMYAGDTVKFTLTVVTASFDATWETCVALVSHVLP